MFCLYVYKCVQCQRKSKESIGSSGVTYDYEFLCGCWESNLVTVLFQILLALWPFQLTPLSSYLLPESSPTLSLALSYVRN